ncbi:Gluconate transport-inducing protein [Tieghemiomyces parasiticus]|uniref:Gluconate transport-inducing protein n=1 Tax=Tieghemiomyces parasiticus TaxID=78921 RepID=A0A9W8AIA5_9FUNG|nr:Gluconate transport-inducing protein [Tieghemiomyces parasiticus]
MLESYTGYIETGHDALLLFEACRRGILHRVQRRLGEKERNTIRSGSIFVWDEEESGMKRWTDGKSWSASRVLGCFLTYQETEARRRSGAKPSPSATLPTLGVHSGSASPCTRTSSSPPVVDLTSPSTSSTTASHLVKESGLIKKALSLTTTDNHKLHLICYYSKADILARRLTTPTYDPRLAGIAIPYGYYPEMAPELGNPTETVFYSPAYAPRESQLPVYLVNRTPSYPPHYGHLPLQHSAHVRFGPPVSDGPHIVPSSSFLFTYPSPDAPSRPSYPAYRAVPSSVPQSGQSTSIPLDLSPHLLPVYETHRPSKMAATDAAVAYRGRHRSFTVLTPHSDGAVTLPALFTPPESHTPRTPQHLPPLISPKRLFDVVLGESSQRPKMEPLPPPSSLFDAAVSSPSPVPVLSVYSEDRRQLDALRSVLTL